MIDWIENMIDDLQKVKQLFSWVQCRVAPDFSENTLPFILTIDFSKVAIGAVLSQEHTVKKDV